jgi:peptidoglycan/xylan/chitin deacetylase (PgdA/CDA1 family)
VLRVALTYDAEHPDRASTPGVQERLLDTLDLLAVRATFFVQGRWAEAYPATARRIGDGGHLVGNHSHYHARMNHLSDEGLAFDLAEAHAAILETTGCDPRPWFRCPFGEGPNDPRVLSAIEAAGYRHVGWDVEAFDWEPDMPAATVVDVLVNGAIEHGDGSIMLLHTWPDQALQATPEIVSRLRDAGAELVRCDELIVVSAA